jgi:hypothetical protein
MWREFEKNDENMVIGAYILPRSTAILRSKYTEGIDA